MARGPAIREINLNSPAWQRSWRRLPEDAKKEGKKALRALLLPPDQRPARLHLHKMHTRGDDPIWSLHLTRDDTYKATLSVENGVAVMRRCGRHEEIDRNPQ